MKCNLKKKSGETKKVLEENKKKQGETKKMSSKMKPGETKEGKHKTTYH